MDYIPFVQYGKLRNFHISECENIPYSELIEKDFYKNASRIEQIELRIIKCGIQLARFNNTKTEWYEDYWKAFIKNIEKSIMEDLATV